MIGAVGEARGLLPLIREDALSLALFFGPGLAGPTAITALMLLGVISGATSGLFLFLWAVFSFFVCLGAYTWVDERGRRERISAFALAGMPRLASRVIALYSLPVSSPDRRTGVAEVFALYRQAQRSLEVERNPWRAHEMIEHGVSLADEILAESPTRGLDCDDYVNRDTARAEGRWRS